MKRYFWVIMILILTVAFAFVLLTQYKIAERQNKTWNNDYQEYSVAEKYVVRGKYSESLDTFDRLLSYQDYSDSMTIFWMKGNALVGLGKLDEAEKCYIQARTLFPAIVTLDDYLKDYAYLKLKQGDLTTAEKYLKRLVQITTNQKLKEWAEKNLNTIALNNKNLTK
ncbi:MAG: hypothetical protein GX434_08605 [Peptococcaceae bacterium]|nr:hypothetical protein [Peptococcaceae bacterium]